MIQPKLWAGMGNQLFMISAAISHALKMGTTYSIPKKTISPQIWRTYFSHLPEIKSATIHYYKEKRHCYDPLPEVDSLTIEGYFQSERYFADYKVQIAEALGFVHKPEPYVAVHIRRGDYLKYPDQFPVMPIEYYKSAIHYVVSMTGIGCFRIYSDDISWCKQNITPKILDHTQYDDIPRYEYSENKDPLTDMKDMYNASAFIIGNSTFSLFPALLRSDNPVVIAPGEDRWYGPKAKHLETCDLMPERFIKI
jgi:glycosyl transferase family 11